MKEFFWSFELKHSAIPGSRLIFFDIVVFSNDRVPANSGNHSEMFNIVAEQNDCSLNKF